MKKSQFQEFEKLTDTEKEQITSEIKNLFRTKITIDPHLKRVSKTDQRQQIVPGLSSDGQLCLL